MGPEGKVVKNFLLSYVRDANEDLKSDESRLEIMREKWKLMLAFIHKYFPEGFRKTSSGRKVPRVRFEALAVGVGLALARRVLKQYPASV